MARMQGGSASRRFQRRIVAAWVVALGLHAVLLLVMLRPGQGGFSVPLRAVQGEDRLQVRMRVASPAVQAPPAIVMPAPVRVGTRSITPSTATVGTPAPRASTNQGEGRASPALQLRNVDGSIRLPAKPAQTRAAGIADMRHFQKAPCRGTRFARSYSRGQDETLGAEVARKYLSWIGLYNPLKEQQYRERANGMTRLAHLESS